MKYTCQTRTSSFLWLPHPYTSRMRTKMRTTKLHPDALILGPNFSELELLLSWLVIRSQFLLNRTPPFLAFGLNQLVMAFALNQLVSAVGLNGFSIILYTPEGRHRLLGWRGKEWPRKNRATRPIKAEKQRCAISEREIWFLRNKCYKLKQKCSWLKINWQLGRKSFDKLILFESKGLPLMWFSTDWLKPQHIARQHGAGSNFLCLILNFFSHLI